MSLRKKGREVTVYVREHIVALVDGVEMTFGDAKALDQGRATLDQIAALRRQQSN
jgi:hypothetical protein